MNTKIGVLAFAALMALLPANSEARKRHGKKSKNEIYGTMINKVNDELQRCLDDDLVKVTEDYNKKTGSSCEVAPFSSEDECPLNKNIPIYIETCGALGECGHYNLSFLMEGNTYWTHYNCDSGGSLDIYMRKGKHKTNDPSADSPKKLILYHDMGKSYVARGKMGDSKARVLELKILNHSLDLCRQEVERRKSIIRRGGK